MTSSLRYDDLLAAITVDDGREILDPATGERVGLAPDRTVEDLDAAIARSVAAQPRWAAVPDVDRCDRLLRAADAVDAAAEPLAELLSREQGKPSTVPTLASRWAPVRRGCGRRPVPSFPTRF